MECDNASDCTQIESNLPFPKKVEGNRIYIDVDNNLEPKFRYYLSSNFDNKQVFTLYQAVVNVV